jgi:hypothetical protein
MGQAPLDLPDPLQAKPLANAGAADDLLSQMASHEIDRLLAQADVGNDESADDSQSNEKTTLQSPSPADAKEPEPTSVEPAAALSTPAVKPPALRLSNPPAVRLSNPPAVSLSNPPAVSLSNPPAVSLSNPPKASNAPPKSPQDQRNESAVSSFVAKGDPALEAELDDLLADLKSAPPGNPEALATPAAEQAHEQPEGDEAEAPASEPPRRSTASSREQGSSENAVEPDPVVKGELDQVFDKMTASADPAPIIDVPTTSASAKPGGSINLLKVLDPIVAEDAAKAQEAAAPTEATTDDEEAAAPEDRLPIYVLALEWVNAPLEWLPPAVRDAMGKIGILTLINAAAVLLYVLLFRRR